MFKMKMTLWTYGNPRQVETILSGANAAEICMQLPETINRLLRHLDTESGVTYEQQTGQETAVVRQSSGSPDADPRGE